MKRFALTKSEDAVMPVFLEKPMRVARLLHVHFSGAIGRHGRAAMKVRGIAARRILSEGRATATPTTPQILENSAAVARHEY